MVEQVVYTQSGFQMQSCGEGKGMIRREFPKEKSWGIAILFIVALGLAFSIDPDS